MLWEIVDTPHRLLGSMHVLPANVSMPDWVAASYEGIERFVFESDVRCLAAKQFGVDKTGKHLKLYGASEIYLHAKRLLNGIGVNEPFEAFRPWRASFFLENCFTSKFGFSGENGVDHRLRLLADEKTLLVDFFESRTRSHELYDDSCRNFQGGLAYFKRTIRDTKSGASKLHLERTFRAWMSSDLADLSAVFAEELAQSSYIANVHLQRNREWVTVAKRLISENIPTLFVVGALHTVGKGSFIEQMGSAGFRFNFIS
jgi:uncharacterized protein YbaP (TraB family)